MIISKARQLTILHAALDAAIASCHDAGTHEYSTADKFQLNEQWCQSYIGFAINDCLRKEFDDDGGFVTFETSVGWLKNFANSAPVGGRPRGAFSDRGRYDLVAWDNKGRPSGVIEIKDVSNLASSAVEKDCLKIQAAIDKLDTVRWGLFLFSVRASAGRSVDRISEQLDSKSKKITDAIYRRFPNHAVRHEQSSSEQLDQCRMAWTGVLFQESRSR